MGTTPAVPSPPLSFPQILELTRIAASDTPSTGSTLLTSPLAYHGLIAAQRDVGTPCWVSTHRGRRWLGQFNAHRAARAVTIRRVTAAQLKALRLISASRWVGAQVTEEALYRRGLIDWTNAYSTRWTVTAAGAALLARETS